MLGYVRPSNEALLRARVPGAQDQRGCPSNPFHRARSASKKDGLAIPAYPFQARSFLSPAGGPIGLLLRASNDTNDPTELAHFSLKGVAWISPQLRTSNDHSFIVGVP